MGTIGTMVAPSLVAVMRLADLLVQDIPALEFGRMPEGVMTNSPAFCFGHLAIYPDRLLEMVGRGDLAAPDERFVELFAAGKDCVDDPRGTVYPSKDVIVERFRARHTALVGVLADVPDEVMSRGNPQEKYRDRFPTIGAMVVFLVCAHPMLHLGQVSAWRRIKGMPSAM